MREIYDVVTKETIKLDKGLIKQCADRFNVDPTGIFHLLSGRMEHAFGRFILPENKYKIFTLVDLDTNQEYDCITNKTIFVHFNLSNNDNESKYISRMKKHKQHLASICGKVMYLKEHGIKYSRTDLKNSSKKMEERHIQIKLRQKIYSKLLLRIYNSLKVNGTKKSNHSEILIGCKIDFFIGYLEALFTKGMSWNNYGEWHIDHIIPCISFDLNIEENQLKCFHYSNLRPLWATREIAVKYGEPETYVGNLNRKKDGSN